MKPLNPNLDCLVNDISNHIIIFTYLINNSHKINIEKFIKTEKKNHNNI